MENTEELKNLYKDVLEALKSIELLSVVTFIGVFLRANFPKKFNIIFQFIGEESTVVLTNLVELLLLSFLLICTITFVLGVIFYILWKGFFLYSDIKRNSYNDKMGDKLINLQCSFYGCDIRFIKISQWVVVLLGILFIMDPNIFAGYKEKAGVFMSSLYNYGIGIFLQIGLGIILVRVIGRLFKSIFYKYLFFHSDRVKTGINKN